MPTGYTADVANGKITDFTEYALQCARNFGACIMLRDEPLSSEIPEFEPSDFYAKSLADAEQNLEAFLAMDETQRREMQAAEHAANVERAKQGIAEDNDQRMRYEAMLEKAKEFKSPSPEHDNYAKFLVSQLEESIEFDCHSTYWNELHQEVSFEQWQEKKLADLQWSVVHSRKSHAEEVERTASRNRWVRQLKEALGVVPQVV